MREPKNPYPPHDTRHGAFDRGVEAASAPASAPQPPSLQQMTESDMTCGGMRASAKTMIGIRISQLHAEIDGLRSIAKFAEAMENTPADEYLWKLIVGQRTI